MARIRKMTESDLDRVAEIAAAVFSMPWSRQGFAETLPMDNACFLVAEENGEILGFCGLYMAADEGEILNVAVLPPYQKRGVADQMLKELLCEGSRCGITRYFLEVRVSNAPAIRLYEKNGFLRQGIRKGFYQNPDEDAYQMNRIEEETSYCSQSPEQLCCEQ